MTVNLNLAGLPAVVLPCGFAPADAAPGAPLLPVGLQLIGRMFGEAELLAAAHVFEATARVMDGAPARAAAAGAAAPAGARR
jgi:aspartyl-tRNA(Asn)/glutamyl-tRNA(Gln) amidotransferase subunit A